MQQLRVDPVRLFRAQEAVFALLEKSGLEIHCTPSRDEYLNTRLEESGGVSPLISTSKFDLNLNNYQGIILRGDDNLVVGQCALRIEELGRVNLAEHWSIQQNRCYSEQNAEVGSNHAPGAYTISGRVAYFGDFYVTKEFRKSADQLNKVSDAFGCFCQMAALTIYQPDYTYALVSSGQTLKGLCTRIGFAHIEPFAASWQTPPYPAAIDEYIAYNDFDDLLHLMLTLPSKFRQDT